MENKTLESVNNAPVLSLEGLRQLAAGLLVGAMAVGVGIGAGVLKEQLVDGPADTAPHVTTPHAPATSDN